MPLFFSFSKKKEFIIYLLQMPAQVHVIAHNLVCFLIGVGQVAGNEFVLLRNFRVEIRKWHRGVVRELCLCFQSKKKKKLMLMNNMSYLSISLLFKTRAHLFLQPCEINRVLRDARRRACFE